MPGATVNTDGGLCATRHALQHGGEPVGGVGLGGEFDEQQPVAGHLHGQAQMLGGQRRRAAVKEFERGDVRVIAERSAGRNQESEVGETAERGHSVCRYRMQSKVHGGDHTQGSLGPDE